MSLLSRVQGKVAAALARVGTTCTVEAVAATYSPTTGAVTETVTTHSAVPCTDIYDEVQQMGPADTAGRATARMVLGGSVAFTPTIAMRVLYQSRRWSIDQVEPIRLQGGVAAYLLTLSEIGASG